MIDFQAVAFKELSFVDWGGRERRLVRHFRQWGQWVDTVGAVIVMVNGLGDGVR